MDIELIAKACLNLDLESRMAICLVLCFERQSSIIRGVLLLLRLMNLRRLELFYANEGQHMTD